jgi:acetyl esterase/lipase
LAAAAAAAGTLAPPRAALAAITYQELLARPAQKPDVRIPYGPSPSQFVELWLPKSAGPYPVAILLHGGCWRSDLPGLELMNLAAGDLRRRGFAVWNIEYRRVDEPGGAYPGAFADVASAVDLLRTAAPGYRLDLGRLVAVGHSAGGHLALWAAARPRLPRSSPLWSADPLRIPAVISLGGFSDLKAQKAQISSACGRGVVERLTGEAEPGRTAPYADTSPADLLPLGVRQVLVHATLDPISPPPIDLDYGDRARRLGDPVDRRLATDAGHFELITPGEPAWAQTARIVEDLTRPAR